jgi:anti-anti-sigma factor
MEIHPFSRQVLAGDTLKICPGKVLDNSNAHCMVDTITDAQAEGFKFILIDMTELEFLSSAGVGSILGTIEISRETGGDIILCNVPEPVRHVLKALDIEEFLTIQTGCQRPVGVGSI